MPPTDVVTHDLPPALRASVIDWADIEPMPLPVVRQPRGEQEAEAAAKPPRTTRVPADELDTAPYQSIGKMSLIIDGKTKGASGWVVAPRAFITAGHCVYYEPMGGWITRAAFCPRYDNACTKTYEVTAVYTLKGWIDSGAEQDRRYDMAACVVSENFADTEPPLAFDTGILPGLRFAAVGYPITPMPGYDFNGKRMWRSAGYFVSMGNGVQWAENNLTNGSSGGPWCEPDNNFVVSGLTSYREDDPNTAASPLFSGGGFQNLYNAVKDL